MKLLIDNALSPKIAEGLAATGYQAVHVRQLGMGAASDESIFQWCLDNEHVVVSADADFGALLAQSRRMKPSVLLLRRIAQSPPAVVLQVLLANLPSLAEPLDEGSIVVVEEGRIRVRALPIYGPRSHPSLPK
jgi:predicted nuclease of predicted toxin-antitoxin system